MQNARLHEFKMPSIAADAAEARCLLEENFKVKIKVLRQGKGAIAATSVAATAIAAVKLVKAIPVVKEKSPEIAKAAGDIAKGDYSEVGLSTRTLLEPTRTRWAEHIDRPLFKPSATKRFYSYLLEPIQ